MQFLYVVFLWFLLLVPGPAHTADFNNGMKLHQDHCMRCHQSEIYTRQNSIVKNLEQLEKRVQQCELANELGWFEEEVEDVIAYLNATYYLFGMK